MAGPVTIDVAADRVRCCGAWVLANLSEVNARLAATVWPAGAIRLDGSRLTALDTGAALRLLQTLDRLQASGQQVEFVNWRPEHQALFDLVQRRWRDLGQRPAPPEALPPLARLGQRTLKHLHSGYDFLSFTGVVTMALVRALLKPTWMRWRALAAVIETAGVNALPIVGLLGFLMGVVIAYQGGLQLRNYGANIFVVELVCLTLLRELAPLLTAIIVAGRTGSAFTAQIGTMRVTEEVDALSTIGIDPMAILVLPKLLGLLVVLPLLTLFADALGILGGILMAWAQLAVNPQDFVDRIPQAVSVSSLLLGLGKAPVFAAIIALVGCYQGFQVSASAESVGRRTTLSVVQSIFLVIVADAVFSVLFSSLGI